jgi:hypothetical protein
LKLFEIIYIFQKTGYPAFSIPGYQAKSGIQPDTGYQKMPDYPAGRISGASPVYNTVFRLYYLDGDM